MTHHRLNITLAIALAACTSSPPEPPPPGDGTVYGVFEGRFPCETCERLKTAITLFVDPETSAPARYSMRQVFVGQGDTAYDTDGSWSTSLGTPRHADDLVITMRPDTGEPAIRYLQLDDNILLLLDDNLRLRVGNASHAFTLSRTQ
jgi:hypothetical protein